MIATGDIKGKGFSVRCGKAIPENIIPLLGGEEGALKSGIAVKSISDYEKMVSEKEAKQKEFDIKAEKMRQKKIESRKKKSEPEKSETVKAENAKTEEEKK